MTNDNDTCGAGKSGSEAPALAKAVALAAKFKAILCVATTVMSIAERRTS